ncbi:MAG: group II intron reverse transcriptase/maturase [Desulfobacteraceae bacterium]|nr:group II intron reverse transcriptase/maturase [Desulfobacteraceae bacterium]
MGDTQRSQTISPQNHTSVKQATQMTSVDPKFCQQSTPPLLVGEISLNHLAIKAKGNPEMVFTSLAHGIDLAMLREAYRRINKRGAAGVDKVTAASYAQDFDNNLYNLYQQLRRGQYAATPVKRIWIEKENGKLRPIGIPAFEDKIVQKAVEMILSTIYEPKFYKFSYGFRMGKSPHQAVKALREHCIRNNTRWIVSADITGLFDNIDHKHLRDILKLRVNDGGIIRLIGKWLKVGVMEEGKYHRSISGTPQGGVISPVLSNIFLHHVLDDWFVKQVHPRMKGQSFLIRFADDYVTGFELESDARRALAAMQKRFERLGLELHPDKTKLIPFGWPCFRNGKAKKPETFDFLGFTFYRGISLQGQWVIKKKTARKRIIRFKKMIWDWCKKNRHQPILDQYSALCSKLRGYYQYFGVVSNMKALRGVWYRTIMAWRYWLSRRCHKGKVKYEDLMVSYPLPMPRIVHNV